MTLLEIKTNAAAYLEKSLAELTVLGQDLFLVAANQAKQTADHAHDFSFQRKILTLSVNSVTGGNLDNAVIQGTATTVTIKTLVGLGLFDTDNNFRPVEWETVELSQERQRGDNRYTFGSWGSRDNVDRWPRGRARLIIRNNSVFFFPLDGQPAETVTIGIEAFVFSDEWTIDNNTATVTGATGVTGVNDVYYRYGTLYGFPLYFNVAPTGSAPSVIYAIWNSATQWYITLASQIGTTSPTNYHSLASSDLTPVGSYTGHGTFTGTAVTTADAGLTPDIWTTRGAQFILWQSIVTLNQLFKQFVPRQEGNLPPPQALADAALAAFIEWDTNKFELNQSKRK